MADVHSKETRSYSMRRIRSKNTKPEIAVRKFLFANGYRFRLHRKDLPGKPDIVLPKYKTVVFVNGCFWHGHENCKYFVLPKTRADWWKEKINRNKELDLINHEKLIAGKWKVITIFECELKKEKIDFTLNTVIKKLKQNDY